MSEPTKIKIFHQAGDTPFIVWAHGPVSSNMLASIESDIFERAGDEGDRKYVQAIREVLARRLCPQVDGDRAPPAFSPMWLAPLDGSPVMLYMPTSSDKFGVGRWHGSMHSTDGVWVDEDDRIFAHTPAGFMALSNLERLTAALTEADSHD